MILLIEITRGMAALWVFLFHVRDMFRESSPAIFQLAGYGSLGVPMFLVISGYVITYSAESCIKANHPASEFLKKRCLRIYPAFWASVCVVLAAPWVIAAISMLKSGSFQPPETLLSRYDLGEWVNFLLLTKVFFSSDGDLQGEFNAINSVYWSLAIEMQFYIVIFVFLCLRKYYKGLIFLLTLCSLVSLVYPFDVNAGFFIHFWPMFASGIALAYMHKNGFQLERLFRKHPLLVSACLAFCLAAAARMSFAAERAGSFSFAVLFTLALWISSPWEGVLANLKKIDNGRYRWLMEPFLILGTMSYSIYLLHGKIHQIPNMFVRQVVGEDSVIHGMGTMVLTLMLCFLFYLAIERRFISKNYANIHKQTLA